MMVAALPPRRRIVEFGSLDVNGTVRDLFPEAQYVGVDLLEGPGVDVVADAATFVPDEPPDTVLCLNMLEHASQQAEVLANALRILEPGGWLIFSAAAADWPEHGADGGPLREGEFYRAVDKDWLCKQLGGLEQLTIRESSKLIYARGQKSGSERRPRRLNVGCGLYPLPYWENLDSSPDVEADIHEDALSYLARCTEGSYDEIFAGHFLEHLDFENGACFLDECYRALRPGGRLGIVVPDTREILMRWLAGSHDCVEYPQGVWRNVSDLDEVCHLFLYSDVLESRHQWAYDRETLGRALAGAGFVSLREGDRYRDPRLGGGAWYQCLVDGYKPRRGRTNAALGTV